ncbi:MAG: hypothetical protein K2M42_09310 [Oscillospiraceae bacterium]|nr:hypothetical protein [Oscillospiraceae bacterium]
MKRNRCAHRISLLSLLAPFLVDRWAAHRDGFTFWKMLWLWDMLDEDEARRRDDGDGTCI